MGKKTVSSTVTANHVAIKGSAGTRPKMSAYMREKKFRAAVKELSARDICKLVQVQPFSRMIKSALEGDVQRVGTEATALLMEAAVQYVHEIYAHSFGVTETSGKRKCLMVRDLEATLDAKAQTIVG